MSDAPACGLRPLARPIETTRELQPWFTNALDVADCWRNELSVPLLEHERAAGLFEHWPQPVRVKVLAYLKSFEAEHPKRSIVAITHGVVCDDGGRPCCITIIHHRGKTP